MSEVGLGLQAFQHLMTVLIRQVQVQQDQQWQEGSFSAAELLEGVVRVQGANDLDFRDDFLHDGGEKFGVMIVVLNQQ